MRHLTITTFGQFLGVTGNRLAVQDKDGAIWETPLSRLRSIRIEKPGVSISAALILACASRGIRLYFVDWRNIALAAVCGQNQHAVVNIRQAQFRFLSSCTASVVAHEMVRTKIRNQRALLLYFGKYISKTQPENFDAIRSAAQALESQAHRLNHGKNLSTQTESHWLEELLGIEGYCAREYWHCLASAALLGESFCYRQGRGAIEPSNAALNYGYAILMSYVWSALDNAGLELYAGIFHSNRPGKPSLVLDFMEEYRAWVVDRNIVKLRKKLNNDLTELTPAIKHDIVDSIDETMASKILWHGKKLSLENIMQRQAYRLAGTFIDQRPYRGIRFKW